MSYMSAKAEEQEAAILSRICDLSDEFMKCVDMISDEFLEILEVQDNRDEFGDFIRRIENTRDADQIKIELADFIVGLITDELWRRAEVMVDEDMGVDGHGN